MHQGLKTSDYEMRILAFVDILGFRQIVNEAGDDISSVAAIHQMLVKARDEIALPSQSALDNTILQVEINTFRTHHFSDLLTISCPLNSFDYFNVLCAWIESLQVRIWTDYKVPIRGSIVYGKLIDDDKNIIFGPALIEAYRLESKVARWPRVIVDKSVMCRFADKQESLFSQNIRKDSHGNCYLDYLRDFFHIYENRYSDQLLKRWEDYSTPVTATNPIEYLNTHKIFVTDGLRSSRKQSGATNRIYNKYIALANYHNRTVDLFVRSIRKLIENPRLLHDILLYISPRTRPDKPKTIYSGENPKYTDIMPLLGIVIVRVHLSEDRVILNSMTDFNTLVNYLFRMCPNYLVDLSHEIDGMRIDMLSEFAEKH
jgi:hypothetical protein